MADYKKTLNLPKTSYPMKADLVQKEPEMLKFWEKMDTYNEMLNASGQKGEYILHDGPPYANGHIHLGTALNKILKDIIVKSKNMSGYKTAYIPGWDCHGLPIERNVEIELGEKKALMPKVSIRKACRKYAQKFLDIQRKEFKRLGVFGLWDKPYMSMDPSYEAVTASELAHFAENGNLNRSKKPIYWCNSCQTALAEAEVEYADHTSPSVFVRFPLPDEKIKNIYKGAHPDRTYIIIWTTTPWTLPDNLAVCLHPEFNYALVSVGDAQYILAEDLVESCAKKFGWDSYSILGVAQGQEFDRLEAKHPFYDRTSLVILGDHVTLDAGTGCVHTAPGHGREDYEVGLKYGLEAYSPLDNAGRFLPSVEFFHGMNVFEANPHVLAKLEEVGNSLTVEKISHSYPHCWRCKEPVIFRATTQWFITMEKNDLRKKALNAIRNDVNWIPAWGEDRIYNMIEQRPDWCISRQRTWGVPILALLCQDCGEAWQEPNWMREIAGKMAKHPTGCDYWYEAEDSEIIPEGLTCSCCNGKNWKRESDILDVWFDSGTSFAAVMEAREEGKFPADLYLEGSDQHRGWFHSSLLASVGTRGVAPYRNVLTHGYVVDGDGRKMSKSIGNVVAPQEVISQNGAELLRLWVSSVDYRDDIRFSNEIMNRLVDSYRRIRNTIRYLLGSVVDLTLDTLVPVSEMDSLDRFALDSVAKAHLKIQDAYSSFEFHKIYHTLHGLCATELSAFYFDILKDRLYASHPESKERRSAQTALYHILMMLLRDMAPVLSFTAEESFKYIPPALAPEAKTVFALPACEDELIQSFLLKEDERQKWEKLLTIRSEITKAIEPIRKSGEVGHSLDTRVELYLNEDYLQAVENCGTEFRAVCIVSQLIVKALSEAPAEALSPEAEGMGLMVSKAHGEKCERCWIYSDTLGTMPQYETLCPRCSGVMAKLDSQAELDSQND